ncbi:O-methyltransferase [bacterium]|nr:O-methyltransferase [bacterium]
MAKEMIHLLPDELNQYIEDHLPERPDVFHDMEKLAAEKKFPIIGPQVGQYLKLLALSINARRVFELGSGFGYSALWFALGMPDEGQIVLTDEREDNLEQAEKFMSRLWQNGKADFLAGNALDHFSAAKGAWDIVFNDIDKEQYPDTIELAYEKLRPGGFFVTDNVLWGGTVVSDHSHPSTRGVLEFNKRLRDHPGFENAILPVRDGLAVARKVTDDWKPW